MSQGSIGRRTPGLTARPARLTISLRWRAAHSVGEVSHRLPTWRSSTHPLPPWPNLTHLSAALEAAALVLRPAGARSRRLLLLVKTPTPTFSLRPPIRLLALVVSVPPGQPSMNLTSSLCFPNRPLREIRKPRRRSACLDHRCTRKGRLRTLRVEKGTTSRSQ